MPRRAVPRSRPRSRSKVAATPPSRRGRQSRRAAAATAAAPLRSRARQTRLDFASMSSAASRSALAANMGQHVRVRWPGRPSVSLSQCREAYRRCTAASCVSHRVRTDICIWAMPIPHCSTPIWRANSAAACCCGSRTSTSSAAAREYEAAIYEDLRWLGDFLDRAGAAAKRAFRRLCRGPCRTRSAGAALSELREPQRTQRHGRRARPPRPLAARSRRRADLSGAGAQALRRRDGRAAAPRASRSRCGSPWTRPSRAPAR